MSTRLPTWASILLWAGLVAAAAVAVGRDLVSGGVYGSPQLLLLSGVGPGAHLKEMGIGVINDLPAVGANLHDHFNSYVAWRSTKPVTSQRLAITAPKRSASPSTLSTSRASSVWQS